MPFVPTGDAAIDAVRQAAAEAPTDESNHEQRYLVLQTFRHFLQRQGSDTISCGPVHDQYRKAGLAGDREHLFAAIDEEFRLLDGLHEELTENPPVSVPSGEKRPAALPPPRDWPVYGGNPQHTAATEDRGPVEGTLAWRRPMALAWYPRPVVEDGRVYAASPGMRTVLHCVDADSGELIWATPKRPTDDQDELTMVATHRTRCAASTPVMLGDTIVLNEIGPQHIEFAARSLLFIRKSDGRLVRKADAGTLDYRVGHSIVTGNEKMLVYPAGTQRIQEVPPHIVGTSRITCVDTASGEELWDFYIGPTHGEPVLDGDRVYAGTADGVFFCLNADIGTPPPGRTWGVTPRRRVAWQYKAGGAINSTAVVRRDRILFGANDGCVYCLDKSSGKALWKHQMAPVESRAFMLFPRRGLRKDACISARPTSTCTAWTWPPANAGGSTARRSGFGRARCAPAGASGSPLWTAPCTAWPPPTARWRQRGARKSARTRSSPTRYWTAAGSTSTRPTCSCGASMPTPARSAGGTAF